MVAWGQPVKTNNWAPDARWYGHRPTLVGAVEGPAAEALIPKIRAAVARYPYSRYGDYSVWPGPNSNSFTAYVLSAIPEAGITLPPTAVGKDWRADGRLFGLTPSGTGIQLSLGGLFGVTIGWVEGVEVNVLGLVAGLDIRRPALKLPGFGRIGVGTVADRASRSAALRPAASEQERQQEAGDEAADVRHVGHAALVGRLGGGDDGADAAEELQDDPEPEHDERRHGDDPIVDEHVHPRLREHEDVGAEHAGDRP